MNPLLAAHRHTQNNRAELEASQKCGCCVCQEIVPTREIVAWTGLDMSNFENPDSISGEETAVCPRCGSEALIGDKSGYPISPDFLYRMNMAWFQKTQVRKIEPKK